MPRTLLSIVVEGSVEQRPRGLQLVLSRRLGGRDTFLSGHLDIDGARIAVRIFTLDDVTVLCPTGGMRLARHGTRWSGMLHLPHGLRAPSVPADLHQATESQGRTLTALDIAELRYALTFLSESTTPAIREARIAVIVAAMPTTRESAQ